jgi:DNA-directed RNA polymerase subunit D
MKVKTTELKGNKGVLRIEDAEMYFVNSLRRVMLADLPKLAIDDVIIYDNTSALFDEIIAHRLGLIPIPTDLSFLSFRTECKCEGKGCPTCTVRYTLSKEGECVVYSGDLQPEHPSYAITETLVPIVELVKDQRIILEVEAVLGRGKDHAKWQGVLAPRYRMDTVISFDKKHLNDVKAFIQELPKDFPVEIKGDKLELKDHSKLPMFEMYLEKHKEPLITVTKDPTKLTFSFETDGSMSAKAALQQSINILAKKYEEFRGLLKDL